MGFASGRARRASDREGEGEPAADDAHPHGRLQPGGTLVSACAAAGGDAVIEIDSAAGVTTASTRAPLAASVLRTATPALALALVFRQR